MKKTILKIELNEGAPLDIEVNGRRLRGALERGVFYVAAGLSALGAVWVTVSVVLPLLGSILGTLVSLLGIGIMIAGTLLAVLTAVIVLGAVVSGRQRRGRWRPR